MDYSHKLKSRKFWLSVTVLLGAALLNFTGTLSDSLFVDLVKWVLGIYMAGNTGAKLVRSKTNV